MKILDFFVNLGFKKDEAGNELFFPWGIFGKGYILDRDETKERIRKILRLPTVVMFSILIVLVVFINPSLLSRTFSSNFNESFNDKIINYLLTEFLILIVFTVVFTAWQSLTMKPILKTLQPSTVKMSWREGYERNAKTIHPAFLWFGLLGSVGFVLFGLWSFFQNPWLIFEPFMMLFTMLAILLSGLIAFFYAYLIKLRNKP